MATPTAVFHPWQRLRMWCWTRPWSLLLLGSPAFLAGVAVAVLALMSLSLPAGETQSRYIQEGAAALARKDYNRALCCFERVAANAQDRPDVLYQLALAAEGVGQNDRTIGLMAELAPTDRPGHAPAHFWWARQLLLLDKGSDRTRATAEIHLLRALEGKLEDREAAHALLGQLYLGRGRLEDAELHLSKAVKVKPYLRLWLARLYAQKKDPDRARQEAEMAIRFYRERAKRDLENHTARLTWADALTFLEDYSNAAIVLEEGLSATRAEIYRLAIARVYLAWYDARKREKNIDPSVLFELLQKGLSSDPANRDLLDRLMAGLRGPSKDSDRLRGLLEQMVATGKAPAYGYLGLSMDAMHRNNSKEALFYLKRAQAIDPTLPIVANNMAYLLAESKPPQLTEALRLSNLAVEQQPDNLTFRDTRGRIFFKMQQYDKALVDLELALKGNFDKAPVHQLLAEIHDKLGNTALAIRHRQLARVPRTDSGKVNP